MRRERRRRRLDGRPIESVTRSCDRRARSLARSTLQRGGRSSSDSREMRARRRHKTSAAPPCFVVDPIDAARVLRREAGCVVARYADDEVQRLKCLSHELRV